ncbi:MAG: DUF3604 domain-containing protein [Desulfobacterales bacterium]
MNTRDRLSSILLSLIALSILPLGVSAGESYSPYVDQSYPTRVYWGDTHVHTALSHDAYIMGNRLMPDDAYRFAKGETVRASSGGQVRLRRPLDFLMVADHAENLGVLLQLAAGGGLLPVTEASQRWAKAIAGHLPLRDILQAEDLDTFNRGFWLLASSSGAKQADYALDKGFRRSVWEEVIANAERHNDPGTFTAFIGYEWSAQVPVPGGKARMIHRNVLYEGGPDKARQLLPFSRFDSSDPEDLWAYLQDYEDQTKGKVLAIPHNANLSGGNMFKLSTYQGKPFTKAYALTRFRWEPIIEVTQLKGDGETHPLVSPTDEFADYETMGNPDAAAAAQSYARSALKLGLSQQAKMRVNPFKFGMIGSTDSHVSLSTASENNFWGSIGLDEPSRYRAATRWQRNAAGYAAVWATANTREALFNGMYRREVYASTGPRITVRFFGGWDYAPADAVRPDLARVGYAKGVPMGGDLTNAPGGKSPRFLIRAVKDPDGANLDRVQVIKGWRDKKDKLHEKIYNVALSDGRTVDSKGNAGPVGSTVDVRNASYTNSIGDPELAVVWTDPDFEREDLAFYYLRVLEIPTPRWTAYDAKFYGLKDLPENIPVITQERAYTSPIWYTPVSEKSSKNKDNTKERVRTMTENSHNGTIDYYPEIPSEVRAPRPVEVWLPEGYDPASDARYPVVYMHDGQFNFHHGQTPFDEKDWLWDMDRTMARLIEDGDIRPAIVVSVWADLDAKPNRGLEYMPQKPVTDKVWEYLVDQEPPFAGGKIISDNYLKFLVRDLKPFIDKTYLTQPDRENTFVMGSSMGGMISAYAITEYPDIFGAAACLSTAWNIGDGVVIAWYKDHWPEAGIHRIYFDHGTETLDAGYGPYQLKMDEVMQSRGYRPGEDWISRRFDGADHTPRAWRERLHIPLIFLLGNG